MMHRDSFKKIIKKKKTPATSQTRAEGDFAQLRMRCAGGE